MRAGTVHRWVMWLATLLKPLITLAVMLAATVVTFATLLVAVTTTTERLGMMRCARTSNAYHHKTILATYTKHRATWSAVTIISRN